jgi:hypothetical protein
MAAAARRAATSAKRGNPRKSRKVAQRGPRVLGKPMAVWSSLDDQKPALWVYRAGCITREKAKRKGASVEVFEIHISDGENWHRVGPRFPDFALARTALDKLLRGMGKALAWTLEGVR